MTTFEDVFLESIDSGLGVLGETVRSSTYCHLKVRHGLSVHDLATKPGAFADSLNTLFGAGSRILLDLIVRKLYLSIGVEQKKHENWKFIDYVAEAKKIFEEQLASNRLLNRPSG